LLDWDRSTRARHARDLGQGDAPEPPISYSDLFVGNKLKVKLQRSKKCKLKHLQITKSCLTVVFGTQAGWIVTSRQPRVVKVFICFACNLGV
jgi:hypothetical protein